MIRLVVIAAIVVLLGTLLLSNINDTKASIADTRIPDGEVASSEADNSDSVSAIITILGQLHLRIMSSPAADLERVKEYHMAKAAIKQLLIGRRFG